MKQAGRFALFFYPLCLSFYPLKMYSTLLAAFKYFFFWLLFFFLERVLFIVYFYNKTQLFTPAHISKVFLYGVWMDASMAAYVCIVPLLFFITYLFVKALAAWKKALRVYTFIILLLCSLITVVNLSIYQEWGSKISYKVVEYATRFPKEAIASSSSSPIVLSLFILACLVVLGIFLFDKIMAFTIKKKLHPGLAFACSLLLIGLEILALRGGWQLAPMNESMAYFSNNPYLNHAAVNTEWSFLNDIVKNKGGKYGNTNPFTYYKKGGTADSIVHSLYAVAPAAEPTILINPKPNIVLIILESFTADVIASLGGEQGIAPNMQQLAKDGILFTNIYASGDRTDKGTVAVLSGFPSQAITSILKFDSKQKQLPCIAQDLAKAGYSTSFYYGGESEFVNTKSYLLNHAYNRIVDKHSFDKKDMNSKWGAFDEVVLTRQLEDLNKEQQPFFSTLLTLTNHEPFELPATAKFGRTTPSNMFKSTAYYTDSCIGDYMRKAAQQPWFGNTLFVLVADHGHLLPANRYDINNYHRFRIPLLFYGGAILPAWRGKIVDKTGSQTDIAATLLRQLNMPADAFAWSKDLLNPASPSFAFYNWDNGFGFAVPEQVISFDNIGKTITFRKHNAPKAVDDSLLRYGEAYMQSVYNRFLLY